MEVALIPIWQVNGHFNRQFNAFGNCLLGQYYLFSSARRKPIILLLNSAVMKASTSRNARICFYIQMTDQPFPVWEVSHSS